jgi:hypothetical protein
MTQIMFIDESGDHNLDPKKIDSSYPIFVLTGCIFDEDYYKKTVVPAFKKLKKDFFGDSNIILHTAEMIRPSKSKEKRFMKLAQKEFRVKFYDSLNKLLDQTRFALAVCVIKKHDQWEEYGISALDPYLLSFNSLLNRFTFQIQSPEHGIIVAEKRGGALDNQLDIAWLNAKVSGTNLVRGKEIKERIENLKMFSKLENDIGLQIADLIASPIGRIVQGLKKKPGHEIDFDIIKKKLIGKNEKDKDYGLTIFPKKAKRGPHSQYPLHAIRLSSNTSESQLP